MTLVEKKAKKKKEMKSSVQNRNGLHLLEMLSNAVLQIPKYYTQLSMMLVTFQTFTVRPYCWGYHINHGEQTLKFKTNWIAFIVLEGAVHATGEKNYLWTQQTTIMTCLATHAHWCINIMGVTNLFIIRLSSTPQDETYTWHHFVTTHVTVAREDPTGCDIKWTPNDLFLYPQPSSKKLLFSIGDD